jgi:hypothetical protein
METQINSRNQSVFQSSARCKADRLFGNTVRASDAKFGGRKIGSVFASGVMLADLVRRSHGVECVETIGMRKHIVMGRGPGY